MPPAAATIFEWDDYNIDELFAHGVQPWEAEEVFDNAPVWVPNRTHGADRWKMVGRTLGGRALTIVVQYKESEYTIRPITGWTCDGDERTRYLSQWRGKR